jgi:hypothetical protein
LQQRDDARSTLDLPRSRVNSVVVPRSMRRAQVHAEAAGRAGAFALGVHRALEASLSTARLRSRAMSAVRSGGKP